MLDTITPVILTYNEEPNIERTLNALTWAKRVVVLDSFSDDATQKICQQFDNVDFRTREFDSHAQQWNAAINQQIETQWVLALDADYCLSAELINELSALPEHDSEASSTEAPAGYETSFIYKIDGSALRGSLYPPVTTLFKRGLGHYEQDGHTQRLQVNGKVSRLSHCIYHDDRKSSQRWHQSQRKYAQQEAKKLGNKPFNKLSLNDKLRALYLGPLLVIPYTLFIRGVILDGKAGLKYTWQRLLAEMYLVLALMKNSKS